jgi:putative nucleotidyltransferase with HDIG domain
MGNLIIPEEIASKVKELPTLSVVTMRIIEIIGDESHSNKDLVKIVSSDPVLTTRVLRIANSAAFARRTEITSLARAIMQLGEKMVVGIAIGSCATGVFTNDLAGYGAEKGELWDHSLRTAIAAREIAAYAKNPIKADEAFTAGLLHDIGKAVISEFLYLKAEKMLRKCDEGNFESFRDAEREELGTDHTEVGAVLAKRWNLPESLSEAIEKHHEPARAEEKYRNIVYAVHLGDLMSMLGGIGTGVDTLAYSIDKGYIDHFELGMKDFDRILLTVEMEFSSVKDFVVPNGGTENG